MIFKTKQEYIDRLLENNHIAIAYSMYCEKFDKSKHSKLMNFAEFMIYINSWEFIEMALIRSIQYYDNKFTVLRVQDLKGNIIAFI
jgi:hypothetical protein